MKGEEAAGGERTTGADAGARPGADREPIPGGGGGGDARPPGPAGLSSLEIRKVRLFVLLLLGAGATYLLGLFLWPFLPAIVISGTLAVLVYPAYRWFEDRLGHRDVAAFVGTTVVFFLVLVPVVGLLTLLVNELVLGMDWLGRQAADLFGPGGTLRDWLDRISGYAPALGMEPEAFSSQITQQLQDMASLVAGRTLGFLSGLGGWLLQGGVALFTLFYLLRDAEGLLEGIKWLVPLDADRTEHLVGRARDVIYATMYGNVVVGAVQGTLGGLAFWAVGIPAAALWGTVMGVSSLLPVVGPPFVWAPAAFILMGSGRAVEGVALFLFGLLVVSTVDNLVRAVVVSERAQLHPLVVLFSVLGGLFLFGAVGFFVGPVLFVIGLSVIEMARLVLEPGEGEVPAAAAGLLLDRITLSGTDASDEGRPPEEGDEGGRAAT